MTSSSPALMADDKNSLPGMPPMTNIKTFQDGERSGTNGYAQCEFVETDLDEDLDEVDGPSNGRPNGLLGVRVRNGRSAGHRELWRRPSYRTALEKGGAEIEGMDSEMEDENSRTSRVVNVPIRSLGDRSPGSSGLEKTLEVLDSECFTSKDNSVDSENEINVDTGVEVRSLENMSTASSSLLSLSSIGSDNSSSVSSKFKVESRDEKQKRDRNMVKLAHISNEYARLTELLDVINPYELREALKRMLQSKDPKLVVALTTLLPRRAYPVPTVAHCARCHKTYNPKLTSNCVLRHPNSKVTKIRENQDGASFRCSACNRDFTIVKMHFYDEAINSYLSGLCFQGRHTTNPREVAFGGAAKSCDVMGCLECYV
ncbi:uncharacterized protein LOC135496793 [Lineus longissimus]|uniref:uncharacterized protein LOC135496793 n=1 Tax=Lineus longissimus TaxID=88925 RepID=UPI00315D4EB3